MSQVKLVAELRHDKGKGVARKARQAGRIPAVMYGWQMEPLALDLEAVTVDRFLGTAASGRLLEVQVGSDSHTVLVKDVQRDPVRSTLLHVDFHKVRLDQAVETSVALQIVGEEDREADEGILAINLHEVLVSCLPTNIPNSIAVDVSGMVVNDTLTVGDLVMPEGVVAVDDADSAVVSVVIPREEPAEEEEEDVAEGEDAEAADGDAAEDADAETEED